MEEPKYSLVLGIISIVCAAVSFIVFWWLSIVAFVLGLVGICLPGRKTCPVIGLSIGAVAMIVSFIGLAVMR